MCRRRSGAESSKGLHKFLSIDRHLFSDKHKKAWRRILRRQAPGKLTLFTFLFIQHELSVQCLLFKTFHLLLF